MTTTVRLTMAQALVRYLTAQRTVVDGQQVPVCAGVFAIFGHGNVAGLGEALHQAQEQLPTFRGQNEQSMGHAATAFAKTRGRRQFMACTTSIGPGATNLVTAAATAHVNRLPLLLLPGDVFANRRPDPVLQQLEVFGEPATTVNDCLRPVSRYWDRINRPDQLLNALPAAIAVLTDPAGCGPVTLALPQDVQTEAYDYPKTFFEPRLRRFRCPPPDPHELEAAATLLRRAEKPLIIAGGGVHYSGACSQLEALATGMSWPVAETQAGKGALAWDHPQNVGAIGVTGGSAANALAREADVVLAVGTRLSDFTTASRTLFEDPDVRLVNLNAAAFDAHKHGAVPLVCDAGAGLDALSPILATSGAPGAWQQKTAQLAKAWHQVVDRATAPPPPGSDVPPSDAEVLGAVNRFAGPSDVVVCAAGGLPGELHKLWRASGPGTYHLEYGYSCMGYEIAGGLGVKMARPEHEVFVLVGDGSYMMMSSELTTSVLLGRKLTVVVLDNHGFGCIERLQRSCGGASFNNRLAVSLDLAAHARALGAQAEKVAGIDRLSEALGRAREAPTTYVIVIETDPERPTTAGGAWWDVAIPEVSKRPEVQNARRGHDLARQRQRLGTL